MTAEFLMRQIRKCMRMLLRPVQLRESVIWELSEVQAVQLIQTMTDCFWMEKNKNFMNIRGKGISIGRICHGAMIPLSQGYEIRAGGYMPDIYNIYPSTHRISLSYCRGYSHNGRMYSRPLRNNGCSRSDPLYR